MTNATTKSVNVLAVAIIVAAAVYFGVHYTNQKNQRGSTVAENWVAVTLDNGIVYFGQLTDEDKQYVALENAYFARNNPAVATKSTESSTDTTPKASTQPDYLLTKVGETEVYGPENTMQINRDHILIIQKLKADSQVIQTVRAQQ